jgi:hypothetical protein
MFILGLAVPDFNKGCNKKEERILQYPNVALGVISCEATSRRTVIRGKYFCHLIFYYLIN